MTDPKTLYILDKLIVPAVSDSESYTLLSSYLYLESSRLLLLTGVVLHTEFIEEGSIINMKLRVNAATASRPLKVFPYH